MLTLPEVQRQLAKRHAREQELPSFPPRLALTAYPKRCPCCRDFVLVAVEGPLLRRLRCPRCSWETAELFGSDRMQQLQHDAEAVCCANPVFGGGV